MLVREPRQNAKAMKHTPCGAGFLVSPGSLATPLSRYETHSAYCTVKISVRVLKAVFPFKSTDVASKQSFESGFR